MAQAGPVGDLRAMFEALSSARMEIPSCGALRLKSSRRWVHQQHTVSAAKILLVVEGRILYSIQGKTIRLDRGGMLYRPARCPASWTDEGSKLNLMYCEFAAERISLPTEAMWTVASNADLERESLQRIRQSFLDSEELSIYKAVAELKVLLMRFFQQAAAVRLMDRPRRGRSGAAGERAVQVALAILSERFAEADILTDLNERVRMSEDHFRRLFRKITGVSPQQYLLRVRLTAAQSFLEKSSLTVKEVAHSVGYHDPMYFSRVYRQHFGRPPTDARRNTPDA